jgi:hypothetical protein
MFVSKRIPFVNAAIAILTLHLNSYRVLSDVRTASAECQGIASDFPQMANDCPPKRRAASTKPLANKARWFCRGRFVPRISGRNGHLQCPNH